MSLQARLNALVGRPLFWVVLVLGIASYPIARAVTTKLPPRLPVLGQLPDFQLVDQNGKPYGAADLRGRVWVANFIFTRCPTVCPTFTKKMFEIQKRSRNIEPAFHLVSFSVDPEHDTPEALARYARQHRASPRMWSFLTGTPDDVKRVVVDGLKVAMGREGPDSDFESIFHGTHFVLVDARGQIRGYYEMSDADAIDRVLRDANLLLNRGD